jgi:membrane protease YdiL (CAAX protease family)
MDRPALSAPPASERGSRIVLASTLAAFVLVGTLAVLGQLGPLFLAALGGGQLPLIALAALGRLAPRAQSARGGAVVMLYVIGALVAVRLWLLAWGLLVLLLAPVVLLLRPVRVRLAGWLPLDPDTFHHWIGLVALLWFITMPIASLPVLGGRPPLEALLAQTGVDTAAVTTWYELLYGLGWTVLLCLIAAGFPVARSLQAALVRLGLTWPGWRGIALGLVVSVLMVPLFTAVDQVATGLVESFGLATTSSAWIERLFGRDFGVLGAVAAAVSAGLGEEMVWRGVIQPRYGLGLAALGFAAMHGFQYGPDGLISVFLSGLILGVLRWRTNTTVAVVAHAGYDLWLLLGMTLGW